MGRFPSGELTPGANDEGPEGSLEDDSSIERRGAQVEAAAHGARLDRWLVDLAREFSRTHLQALITAGLVQVDGQVVTTASRRLGAGQRVEVLLRPTAESRAFRAEPAVVQQWRVIYEDAHVLVIDKPAGLVVHPAPGNWSGTLLNGVLAHHGVASTLPRGGIVHRLDKDTSGLMVVAKTLAAMTALTRAIAAREVRREYLALVHGAVAREAWSIESPIGRDPVSRVRMAVHPGGRASRTDVTRLAVGADCSAVRCRLHTGRTHQIRVHLASQGHPLVADLLYGGRPALGLQRQALHAARLGFAHPQDGRSCEFLAPLPPDLEAAWQQLQPEGDPLATMQTSG